MYTSAPRFPSAAFLRSSSTLPPSYHVQDPNPRAPVDQIELAVVHEPPMQAAPQPPAPAPAPAPLHQTGPVRVLPFTDQAGVFRQQQKTHDSSMCTPKFIGTTIAAVGISMMAVGIALYYWRRSQNN